MHKALPQTAQPGLEPTPEASPLRGMAYALLILLVATGGWVRFSDRIAGWVPALGAPGPAATGTPVQGLLELGAAAPASAEAARQALHLPPNQAAALQEAVSRRRLRLVQLPLFERDGGAGEVVEVSAGGLTQRVQLSERPTPVELAIADVGNVSLRVLGAPASGSVSMGALTLNGPLALPPLAAGHVLELGVVAQ